MKTARSLHTACEKILFSPDLKSKLMSYEIDWDLKGEKALEFPDAPSRDTQIQFSKNKVPFPKVGRLKTIEGKAQAFHAFANHELLAVEMMAAFILSFESVTSQDHQMKRAVWDTLCDEQRHSKLYIQQIKKLGYRFGDFPLNDFFWKQTKNIKSHAHFFSSMSLTFEAANLDFALFYKQAFEEIKDHESALIMNEVYLDEIKHVSIGRHFLNSLSRNEKELLDRSEDELWAFYKENLPFPLTPARAKGKIFDREGRKKAGLSDFFINKIQHYRDDFLVTDRKEWKNKHT